MWKKFRRRLEYDGLVVAYFIGRRLGWGLLRFLGRLCGDVFYLFAVQQRKVAMANLRLAFPELSEKQRRAIAQGCFRSVALNVAEVLASQRLPMEAFNRHFNFSEQDIKRFRELNRSGRGLVVATFHIGNWEWFSLACAMKGVVADIVVQRIKNRKIDTFIQMKREGMGHRVLYAEMGIRQLVRSLKQNRTIGLLIDLNMPRERGGAFLKLFGMPVLSTIAAPALARKTGSALVVAYGVRQPDRRYKIHFHELAIAKAKTDIEIAQQILDIGEAAIRKNPDQWIWMYKRWKFKPKGFPAGQHPFYSYEV